MLNFLLITFGKLASAVIRTLNLGNGSTWPGHIALGVNSKFIRQTLNRSKIQTILIAGTNGKTTTSKLIREVLESNGKRVFQNESGANLLNGIASSLILNSDSTGILNYDYAIFEIDENTLPLILKEINPDLLVLLNLFRDQLDRYGEVNTIAAKWKNSIGALTDKTTIILNADDPQVSFLAKGSKANVVYFGLQSSQFIDNKSQQAADSVNCPKCGSKLIFNSIAFSHLGDWECKKCGLKRPEVARESFAIYPLPGLYNKYNVLAAVRVLEKTGLKDEQIHKALTDFKPAFGRQEIIEYKNRYAQIFLSKNPTSFNQSLTTISELNPNTLLLVLNDRIPDGRDVSWIWDTNIEDHIDKIENIIISGDRAYDMALRIKYSMENQWKMEPGKWKIEEDLENAVNYAISKTPENQTLYILPTYSAMLEVRKILTGKKIL